MYLLFNDIRNFALYSEKDEVGHLQDVYLDEREWVGRYLVVETGGWFSSAKILLGSAGIRSVDLEQRRVVTALSKKQVEEAPPASSRKTVSQANEGPWTLTPNSMIYVAGARGAVLPPYIYDEAIEVDRAAVEKAEKQSEPKADRHLRSCNELVGYAISASDGEIGSVSDLVLDPSDWRVAYLVVDTGNWLPGKLVILPPKLANNVSWNDRTISFAMTRQKVEESPALSSLDELERSHEDLIYAHYGHPMV